MDGHIGPDKEANPAIYLVIFSSRVAKIGEFGCMEELRTPLPCQRPGLGRGATRSSFLSSKHPALDFEAYQLARGSPSERL